MQHDGSPYFGTMFLAVTKLRQKFLTALGALSAPRHAPKGLPSAEALEFCTPADIHPVSIFFNEYAGNWTHVMNPRSPHLGMFRLARLARSDKVRRHD